MLRGGSSCLGGRSEWVLVLQERNPRATTWGRTACRMEHPRDSILENDCMNADA
jgi:hypothetical protein